MNFVCFLYLVSWNFALATIMPSKYTKELQETISFLKQGDNFLLISHDRPDGDTLGSALALYLFLIKLHKKVSLVCAGVVPEAFRFLGGHQHFQQDFFFGDFESVVLVDNGDLKRTGFDDRIKKYRRLKKPIINIDHHPRNDIWKLANINLVSQKVSSTAEIIFDLVTTIDNSLIDSDIATAILTGIYTDTGGFQHPTTSKRCLLVASKLLSHGAKLKSISENLSGHRSFAMLKLWGIALKNIRINNRLGIMTSVITQKDIKNSRASEEDLAGVVNMMSATPEAGVAMLLCETEDGKIRGSLRTDSDRLDVSVLASHLGGGGHKRASGFTVEGRLVVRDGVVEIE